MYITEIKMFALKKRVLIGNVLKGAMEIIKVAKEIGYDLNTQELKKYLLDIEKIGSFDNIDLLYEDMFSTFLPIRKLLNLKIVSYTNKSLTDLIDFSLSNFSISCDFLIYIYSDFFEEFIEEFLKCDFSKDNEFEVIIDIPIIYINNIYINYQNFDLDEKIDKFKEEITIWAMYNCIATITENDFEIIELEDEDILMVQFNIINKAQI